MVAKIPTFIDIHMFSQGHSWWQNYRLLYMVKKQFSQGHSWWQNSRLIYIYVLSRSLMVAKSSQLLYLVYIYMFSQNWYTTNEKEHIAHHIKHFQVSPKTRQTSNEVCSKFSKTLEHIRSSFEISSKFRMVICFNFNYFSKF